LTDISIAARTQRGKPEKTTTPPIAKVFDGGSSQSGGVALIVNVAKSSEKPRDSARRAYFLAPAGVALVGGAPAVFWKL
jgi:hypothetical protein